MIFLPRHDRKDPLEDEVLLDHVVRTHTEWENSPKTFVNSTTALPILLVILLVTVVVVTVLTYLLWGRNTKHASKVSDKNDVYEIIVLTSDSYNFN